MKFKLAIALSSLALASYAQNEADVLRYSSQPMSGTARFIGLGGAMGALGGDMSAFAINPAGIGVYRFGDISFTPALEMNNLTTRINENSNSASDTRLVVNNAGFVLHNGLKHPDWKALNFGIAYNRLNTYNDKLNIVSTNSNSRSLMQDFANEGSGFPIGELSPFGSLLAYDAFVIDTIGGNQYAGRASIGDINQIQTSERAGRHSETNLTFGSNYKDILYLGLALGIQGIRYELVTQTTEMPTDQIFTDLVSYRFTENLEIRGTGFNAKFGAIVKAGKTLRFGGSIQTPTGFLLTDTYRNTITSSLREPIETLNGDSGVGTFEYRLRTPWRYMLSAAGVIGDRALVTVQYEFIDFSKGELRTARSSDNDNIFQSSNDLITEFFTSQNVIRAGVEYRFTESVYGRGGFAQFGNPLPANETFGGNLDRRQYSLGIGYRKPGWNIDLSYQFSTFDEPYLTNTSAVPANITNQLNVVGVTVGLRL